MLDTQQHAEVTAATKDRRNAAARDRRRLRATRRGEADVFEAELGGEPVLFVLTRRDGDRAAILRLDPTMNRWTCSCFEATYSKAKTCKHLAAVAGSQEGQGC